MDLLASRHQSTNTDLIRYWHAYRVVEGHAPLVSMCFLSKAVEPPTHRWEDPRLEPRCYSCTARIGDPLGQDSMWWLSLDPEHFGHCVICHKPVGSGLRATRAILRLRQKHGRAHSVSARAVPIHERCEGEGRALAVQEGFGWEYPPAPEWGDSKAQ